MSGLTRKKITVKRKGKTFQRSVMVRAPEPSTEPKRYMSPSRFLSKHKNQFAGMFAHGVAQGAATHTAGRLVGKRYGRLAGVGAGLAAYKASDHAGTAIWKRAMGKKYDGINQDFSRLAPHTEQAMTRVFHGVGYAGNVVGVAGSWAAHHIISRRGKR